MTHAQLYIKLIFGSEMNTENQIQHNVHIVVPVCDWSGSLVEDIRKLLINTASHLLQLLRSPFDGMVCVIPTYQTDKYPITLYRAFTHDPYFIKLTARNNYWDIFAFEFTHEFCHILSNYEDLKANHNNWFHEAICELASIFTLRCMAERWHSDPPYSNWVSYAEKLYSYSENRLSRPETHLPEGVSLHSWLLHNEDMLRVANYREEAERNKQHLVAYQLLAIFEEFPSGWNAIRNLPTSTGYLKEYLSDWYSSVDLEDQPFVARLSNAFGYTISVEKASDR